jgi:nitroreductase
MDIFEAMKKRRSIRFYQKKDVEENMLLKIVKMACEAPSAANRQEWRFVVVKDESIKKNLRGATNDQRFIGEAPVVIACCADTNNYVMTCGQACYPINVANAIDHITLVAVALGLGTCWVGDFYEDKVKKILSIPSEIRVVALIALGYPQEDPDNPKKRLPLNRIFCYDGWTLCRTGP